MHLPQAARLRPIRLIGIQYQVFHSVGLRAPLIPSGAWFTILVPGITVSNEVVARPLPRRIPAIGSPPLIRLVPQPPAHGQPVTAALAPMRSVTNIIREITSTELATILGIVALRQLRRIIMLLVIGIILLGGSLPGLSSPGTIGHHRLRIISVMSFTTVALGITAKSLPLLLFRRLLLIGMHCPFPGIPDGNTARTTRPFTMAFGIVARRRLAAHRSPLPTATGRAPPFRRGIRPRLTRPAPTSVMAACGINAFSPTPTSRPTIRPTGLPWAPR